MTDHTIHYLPGYESSDEPPLFGGAGQMPFQLASELRIVFTAIDQEANTSETVPFDQIESQFQTYVYHALSVAGFSLPPQLDWDAIYRNAILQKLAIQVAQDACIALNDAQPTSPSEIVAQRAERLGQMLGLEHGSPTPTITDPNHQAAIIPHPTIFKQP